MKRLMLILLIAGAGIMSSQAQHYQTAIGLRGGFANGITVKHFVGAQSAFEAIGSFRWDGFLITGLYEKHAPAFDTERLFWFYGGGGHIGFWDNYDADTPWMDPDEDGYTIIGIDGIVGLEYDIKEIPLTISADWKPAINLVGDNSFWADGGAISVRYTLNTD
ncbi:MAG: hypothetical protein K9I94_10830 [Bacteroidales bacterium]|nr:hypothetical protein [Bacteroidales bacterium]